MIVNRYNFDSIVSKTQKLVTPIPKGKEEMYAGSLNLVERRMLSFYEKHHITGRQAQEIIQIVLMDIKGRIDHEDYDCSSWYEPCYRECADELEALFLPELNPDLKAKLSPKLFSGAGLDSDYFELSRKCLIRIHDSIGLWTKDAGPNGYFESIKQFVRVDQPISEYPYLVEKRMLKSNLK